MTMTQTLCALAWPCNFPRGWVWFQIGYLVTLIILFTNFYIQVSREDLLFFFLVLLFIRFYQFWINVLKRNLGYDGSLSPILVELFLPLFCVSHFLPLSKGDIPISI